MPTIFTSCRVPWAVSPTTSGVTLIHCESSTRPNCRVGFGGGRLDADGRTDDRRIEVRFEACAYARVGPKADDEGIESLGFEIVPAYGGDIAGYLDWRRAEWERTGCCPDPGFAVARDSAWLRDLPALRGEGCRHYILAGRDGFVELIARRYTWREWLWTAGRREAAHQAGPVVGRGAGVD